MDPTWGEELANPSHIALAHGDIIEQVRVLYRVMGNIKIDILDAN
jgi:homoserine acetyltransferase